MAMSLVPETRHSLPSSPHQSIPTAPTSIAHIVDSNPNPSVYSSPVDTTPHHQLSMSDSRAVEERCAPVTTTFEGRTYSLVFDQQPVRARMCGFGDKDRRPITPPPLIRLVVTDATTLNEIDIAEIDTSYYVLTVDLWSPDGTKEVNLVRHSSTSPSISAATSTSYPPPQVPDLYALNVGPFRNPPLPSAANRQFENLPRPLPRQNELFRHIEEYRQQQAYNAIQHHHHVLGGAPPQQQLPPQIRPNYMMGQPQQPQIAYAPSQISPGPPTPTLNTGYYQQQSQLPPQGPLLSPDQLPPSTDPRSQPGGMFTRNLIGSLCVSAFRLTDPDQKPGVWFILQDLSVRTEGPFRLKVNFVNVGNPEFRAAMSSAAATPHSNPPSNSQPNLLQSGSLNTSSAPVLASAFSEVFTVFSAKRFPGVIDSTELSRCFAAQGIKIPIRKDGARGNERRPGRRGGDESEDEDEGGE